MIIIRIISGTISGIGGMLLLGFFIVVGFAALLLFWKANEDALHAPLPFSSACQYGVYDFKHHDHWVPNRDGGFPKLSDPSQYGEDYAVKAILTNRSSSPLGVPGDAPNIVFSPGTTPWGESGANDLSWQSFGQYIMIKPGKSAWAIEPLVSATGSEPPYSTPLPTGCVIDENGA